MTEQIRDYLATAIRAAQAAGKIQQFYLGGELEIETKSSATDIVTEADKRCEARIREIIQGAYPDHVVFGEEEGQPGGEARCRWIVDPIDGTTNYAQGFPFFCVSIGLEIDGVIELGVVFDSNRDELFTATRGGGAFLNGVPLAVTQKTELINCVLGTGFAYNEGTIHENIEVFGRVHAGVRSIRRPGAAALDLCYVACGRLDGFWEMKLKPWDVAAGWLIVREAGGTVTGGGGEPYALGSPVVVASNGHIHMKLIDLLDLATTLA